jgi:hypothetical protein
MGLEVELIDSLGLRLEARVGMRVQKFGIGKRKQPPQKDGYFVMH